MALADNLVAYYRLEGAIGTDATGRSNDLTMNNSPTSATGKVGNAVQLTRSSSQYASRASTSDLSMGDIDFTISCWAYIDTIGAQRYIYSKWSSATVGNEEYSLLYESSGTRFDFYIAGFGKRVRSDVLGAPATSTWYHIVCQHDSVNDLILMYVNGTSQGAGTATSGQFPALNSQQFGLGSARGDQANTTWDGRVDELGIWKRLLSSGEITALYNSGNGLSYADIISGETATGTMRGGKYWGM